MRITAGRLAGQPDHLFQSAAACAVKFDPGIGRNRRVGGELLFYLDRCSIE